MSKPKIRFKGCQGEWEGKKLADCLEISGEKNINEDFGRDDVLSVSDDFGVVNQIELLGRSYAGKSLTNYDVLRTGQIVYTKSPLRSKPYGIVKLNTGKPGIVSSLYAVYNAKPNISADYLHWYFDPAWRLNAYIRPLVNKGAKNTMNISDETALTGHIYIPPTLPEQRQIAAYFRSLDGILSGCESRLSSLRRLKEGALQAFFPQQGETQPKIRFKGCNGEWERKKLGDIARKVSEKNTQCEYKETFTNSAEMGIISQLDYFDHDITNKANISGYYVVQSDDFVYNPRISVTAPVGPISRNKLGRCGIMSPLYTVFHFEKVDNGFMEYYFKTIVWHSFMYQEGNTGARNDRFSIKDSVFFTMPILLPPTLAEQLQIAHFFRTLDRRIELERQRLEKLKQLKAACLEKMFV